MKRVSKKLVKRDEVWLSLFMMNKILITRNFEAISTIFVIGLPYLWCLLAIHDDGWWRFLFAVPLSYILYTCFDCSDLLLFIVFNGYLWVNPHMSPFGPCKQSHVRVRISEIVSISFEKKKYYHKLFSTMRPKVLKIVMNNGDIIFVILSGFTYGQFWKMKEVLLNNNPSIQVMNEPSNIEYPKKFI